jgi:BlaI family transcriptional regulator, penicillinase repressor
MPDKSPAPDDLAISPAEWQVMKVLWERGPLPARDIFAALPREARWAYRTVKTLLSRLVAKGALEYDEVGNSYLYRAAVPRDQMTRQEIRGLVDRVVSGAAGAVLAHFIEEADLSDDEIRRLKRLLDEKRRSTTPKPKRGQR